MDIIPSEKGRSFLSKILGPHDTKDITPLQNSSDFEKGLFQNGVYHFDFDTELHKSEKDYHIYQNWLRRAQPWNEKSSLGDFVGSERHEVLWKQSFDGLIPKHWGEVWYNVMHDLEEAGKRGVQLNSVLVSAAVSH